MPINDKYKVVFVHIPKNGGTTIEYLLGMHGELDTVGIAPYKNQVTNEFLFGAGSQEFTAKEIERTIGQEKFASYTSFCIARNPYSRLVSYVAWALQYRPHATDGKLSKIEFSDKVEKMFRAFEDSGFDDLYLKPQWHYAFDEGQNLLVDKVLKFEEFDKVLSFVGDLAKIDVKSNEHRMPSNHHSYKHYFEPFTLEMIHKMYKLDFELFDYPKF